MNGCHPQLATRFSASAERGKGITNWKSAIFEIFLSRRAERTLLTLACPRGHGSTGIYEKMVRSPNSRDENARVFREAFAAPCRSRSIMPIRNTRAISIQACVEVVETSVLTTNRVGMTSRRAGNRRNNLSEEETWKKVFGETRSRPLQTLVGYRRSREGERGCNRGKVKVISNCDFAEYQSKQVHRGIRLDSESKRSRDRSGVEKTNSRKQTRFPSGELADSFSDCF